MLFRESKMLGRICFALCSHSFGPFAGFRRSIVKLRRKLCLISSRHRPPTFFLLGNLQRLSRPCSMQVVENHDTHNKPPVVVDDRLVAICGRMLWLLQASPGKFSVLSQTNLNVSLYTAPAIYNGRLLIRESGGITCYDLRLSPRSLHTRQ